MNTEPPERDCGYLAEGETPDGAAVCLVGVDAGEPDEDGGLPIDLGLRARANKLRRFRRAGRTGSKIQPNPWGDLLVEVAT